MKNQTFMTTLLSLLVLGLCFGVLAQEPFQDTQTEKRGQTGMKFLSVSLDARSAGMGNAVTAAGLGSSVAMFYNPAAMGFMDKKANVSLGLTEWLVDIKYNYGAVAFAPSEGKLGVFGVSLLAVDYGEFEGTIRDGSESGYMDTGTFSPSALAVGVGYAKAVTSRFSFGANAKYVREDLGSSIVSISDAGDNVRQDNKTSTIAYDFGIMYKTGFRSLTFAMSARNFASDETYEEESFELPLTFRIGLSMNLMDFAESEDHAMLVSVDTERPRDFDEQIKLGGEYTFKSTVSLRAGILFPSDEQGFSVGAGLQQELGSSWFTLDYAYTDFGVFDSVSRVSAQFSF